MKLYHITRRENLDSILSSGLDPQRAKGVRKSVWGVTPGHVAWALIHVLAKPWNKGATLSDLVVIELTLSRSQVRRYQRKIYYTTASVVSVPVTADMVIDASEFGKVR